MGPGVEISGGSAANTMVGLASFGARAAYLGKVRDDQLGEVFAHDIRSTGVVFTSGAATDGPATGRCLIVVTPDAERTMNTFLGASAFLDPDDVDADMVAAAKVVYLEGYLWDRPERQGRVPQGRPDRPRSRQRSLADTVRLLLRRSSPRRVAQPRRGRGRHPLRERSARSARCTSASSTRAMEAVRKQCRVAALTRSAEGSVIVSGEDTHVVAAHPVEKLVDTTGGGRPLRRRVPLRLHAR